MASAQLLVAPCRRAGPQKRLATPALAMVGLLAAGATALATRAGPAITPDGVSYLRMARGLRPLEHPPGHFPDGYPLALSAVHSLGLGMVSGGRWLGVLLVALNVFLAGLYTLGIASPPWAVGVAVGVAAATPLALLHTGLYSEPLFVTTMLGWLLAVRSERIAVVAVAGSLATAAFLIRYAGAALILAGLVLLWSRRPRLRAYAAGAATPLAAWVPFRLTSGPVTSRRLVWHPPAAMTVLDGARSLAAWATGMKGGALAGLVVAAVATLLLIRVRRLPGGEALGIVAASYLVVLASTIALFDAQTPLDGRLVAPLQLLVILACPAVATMPARHWLTAGLVIIVAVTAVATTRQQSNLPRGILDFQRSPTVAAAGRLQGRVISNGPGAIWLMTNREAQWIPELTDPHTGLRNPTFDQEIARLRTQLADDGHVVWLDEYGYRTYLPAEAELVRDLDLRLVERLPDGAVYQPASSLGPLAASGT